MTPTFNQLVYSIINQIRGRSTASEIISTEQIRFLTKSVRAQLIKQDANKGFSADPYIIQSLGCVNLVQADAAECCDIKSGCTLLRTEVPIPSPIELHNQQLFTRIGPVVKTEPSYDYISYERVPYLGFNKFTRNRIKAYQQNNGGYVYLVVPTDKAKLLNKINIQGVFENPEDVLPFTECTTGNSCYTRDMPFPVKSWMVPVIIKMVVDMFIREESRVPYDQTNNAKLDVSPQTEGS